jgi:hypothetical protein
MPVSLAVDREMGSEFHRAFVVMFPAVGYVQHIEARPLTGFGPLGNMIAIKVAAGFWQQRFFQIVDLVGGESGVTRTHQGFGGGSWTFAG